MSKFTPGPWKVINLITGYGVDASLKRLPSARVRITRTLSDQDLANAQLIAAAPDMYKALNELLELLEEHEPNWYLQGHYNRASAALAKARGESDD